MPIYLKSASNKNVMLQSSGLEDNVSIKLRAGKNDNEHISWNELKTPKMSNNQLPNLSNVTSDTHNLQKW